MGKRVLVSGDREWTDVELVRKWLRTLKKIGFSVLIEGEARGADSIARDAGLNIGYEIMPFKAKWNQYSRTAGYIRNEQMITIGCPNLILAFHNHIEISKGTKHMVYLGKKYGIRTILISENNPGGDEEIITKRSEWECPICHIKINKALHLAIEEHKKTHPNNQAAFNLELSPKSEIK
jgi:hypothetical protein